MDFFINFVMRTASYFILAYFIYNIAGRKRKISLIVLSLFTLIETYQVINAWQLGQSFQSVLLIFMLRVLPLLFALFIFLTITGGMPIIHFKLRKKLKSFNVDIQTKRRSLVISYFIMIGSFMLIGLAYFYMEGLMIYVMYVAAIILFFLSVLMQINLAKIKEEFIILCIGKNKEIIYQYQIPKDKMKLSISDVYQNESYIVDAIGEAYLLENQKIEKHYLYWIATSDKVDMTQEDFEIVKRLSYQEELHLFEKYHYKKVWFEVSRMGHVERIKEKLLK